jgi:cytochrome c-type biogenesis protein CcmH
MKTLLGVLTLSLLATASYAIDTEEALEDPALQARYEDIIEEVRCLKCQNTTIKDSNAFLAGDLRREIRRMLLEGMSDEQIFDFLVERYGDFALYEPRASGKTLILWIAPALFLLGGGIVLLTIIRRRMTLPVDVDSADDQQ